MIPQKDCLLHVQAKMVYLVIFFLVFVLPLLELVLLLLEMELVLPLLEIYRVLTLLEMEGAFHKPMKLQQSNKNPFVLKAAGRGIE